MKCILLTKGQIAKVDDRDLEIVSRFKWHVRVAGSKLRYAVTDLGCDKPCFLYMHRLIIKTGRGETVDHVNGDGLDNRRCNLRVALHKENLRSRDKPRNNTSGFKGVHWVKRNKKWRAAITCDGDYQYLGLFNSKIAAAKAYDIAAKRLFKEFAFLNFGS